MNRKVKNDKNKNNINQTNHRNFIDQIYNKTNDKKINHKSESDFTIAYGQRDYKINQNLSPISSNLNASGDACNNHDYRPFADDLCEGYDELFGIGDEVINSEYEDIKHLRSSCLLLEQNNNDLDYAIKRLTHENNCFEPRIEQLQALNKTFIEDNAEYLGRSVENKFLLKDVSKMKDLLAALTKAVNEEVNNHCKLQEEYFKTEYNRKQFERDKMAYELSSIATSHQLNNLSNKKEFLESCKEELIKKKLFINRLHDIKGLFRVILKISPSKYTNNNSSIFSMITDDKVGIKLPYSNNCDIKLFQFNNVFNIDSSINNMAESLNGCITQIISGYNVCLIHFGTSGSGKSYTSLGNLPETQGLSSLLIGKLINDMNMEYRLKFKIEVSFIEFYADYINCLLTGNKVKFQDTGQKVTIGKYGKTNICSLKDYNHILFDIVHKRQTSTTNFSPNASRSHLGIVINVKSENTITNSQTDCRLLIFDLAGFEKSSISPTQRISKQHLDEAYHINNSLACFTQIIEELSINKKSTITQQIRRNNTIYPFRSSKLTQFLKPSFCGDAYCYLLLHISDNDAQIHSICKTLQVGQAASSIELGKPLNHKTEALSICASKYFV